MAKTVRELNQFMRRVLQHEEDIKARADDVRKQMKEDVKEIEEKKKEQKYDR